MAKNRQRPSVGTLTVSVEVGGRARRRTGPRLDDVVRVILSDLVRSYGGQAAAARGLGLTQQNLSRIGGGGGTSIDLLARVCAALGETPVDLFRRYEPYRSADAEPASELERLGSLLSGAAARRLTAIVAEVVERGELEDFLRVGESYAYRASSVLAADGGEPWDGARGGRKRPRPGPRRR